ncbi:MAG: ABC transporter permease [Vicinamibacterales bacterium]|jgi:putative ABC transport system permease protein|nr:ABC transporter permease [Vicinamibacterales bacterium]
MDRCPNRLAVGVLVGCALAQCVALSAQTATLAPNTLDPPGMLISRQLLAAAGVAVGDVVRISATETGAEARSFRVVGSYEPTPDPFRITGQRLEARLHLPDLIALTADPDDPLSSETVTSLNIALVDSADAPSFANDLDRRVPGVQVRPTVRPVSPSEPFAVIERFHLAISIVTLLGSTMFLLALMVMRVDERRETAGVLRLLGVSRSRVILNVFAEGVLIAVVGVVFGVVLALLSQDGFNRFFQWRYDTPLVFVRITPAVIWRSVAYAVPLGLVAAIVSAWLLLRRDVLTLFRR